MENIDNIIQEDNQENTDNSQPDKSSIEKPKRQKSPAQMESWKKALAKRRENIAKKKQEQKLTKEEIKKQKKNQTSKGTISTRN